MTWEIIHQGMSVGGALVAAITMIAGWAVILSRLRDGFTRLEKTLEKVEAKVEALSAQVPTLEARVEHLDREIRYVRAKAHRLDRAILALSSTVHVLALQADPVVEFHPPDLSGLPED